MIPVQVDKAMPWWQPAPTLMSLVALTHDWADPFLALSNTEWLYFISITPILFSGSPWCNKTIMQLLIINIYSQKYDGCHCWPPSQNFSCLAIMLSLWIGTCRQTWESRGLHWFPWSGSPELVLVQYLKVLKSKSQDDPSSSRESNAMMILSLSDCTQIYVPGLPDPRRKIPIAATLQHWTVLFHIHNLNPVVWWVSRVQQDNYAVNSKSLFIKNGGCHGWPPP